MNHESSTCSLVGQCSGCPWLGQPYSEQVARKISHLSEQVSRAFGATEIPPISVVSVGYDGLRDRVDLTLEKSNDDRRLGLFRIGEREIVDIIDCPQMSPALRAWYQDFRKVPLSVRRGSVRLRVGPRGERGVWLDFANVDVKGLLDETRTLEALLDLAHVEIGQRRKVLGRKAGALKLLDPEPRPWFQTFISPEKIPVPLVCSIGDFTQPSLRANQTLVAELMSLVTESQVKSMAEFGSGVGNFTLPMASVVERVDAYEIDQNACDNLELNLKAASLWQKVHIKRGDYQNLKLDRRPNFLGVEGLLVDPPRSGLKGFLEPMREVEPQQRPRAFFYISCFAETFAADSVHLLELGYKPVTLKIVDQFPQSQHYEVVSAWVNKCYLQ